MKTNGMSRRDQIREIAANALKRATGPLHNSQITAEVVAALGLSESDVTPKTVNTCLHDDPGSRFVRVGPGTWELRRS